MENPISPSPVFDPSVVNRDDGKHQINAAHKRRLMEELAAALWRSGEKQWDADRLEDWLDDFLYANPKLADGYRNKDRDVLKGDLRTATFVLRPDGEAKHNRFAHTSLQEYFLACYLVRTLKDEATASAAWDMPIVSVETLDFMGQLLALDPQVKKALTTMEKLMGEKVLRAACLGFAYWMQAIQKGYPEPAPGHVCLEEATDEDLTTSTIHRIRGHSAANPLNLHGANLIGAGLLRLEARWVDLTCANLTGLEIQGAILEDVCLDLAQMQDANLSGSIGRGISLDGVNLTDANLSCCNWMAEGLGSATLPAGWQRSLLPPKEPVRSPPEPNMGRKRPRSLPDASATSATKQAHARWFCDRGGFTNNVLACAWSPDGRYLLSGSEDRTLKVWNTSTHRCIGDLSHDGFVAACSWSPDGANLLSGSADNTLKLWDGLTGKSLRTCRGHKAPVYACAWSHDRRYLLSGSLDRTLKIWDAATGQCLHTLEGHGQLVLACSFSSDSRRILSGSADNTLKVWNASTGKCLRTFHGHDDWVTDCGWSPNGERFVSASQDGSLKLWSVSTGECLHTLDDHEDQVSACAWSPDGRYLLSGSEDETLRIWDADTGKCLCTLEDRDGTIQSCAWSPDGHKVLSASDGATLKIWDAQTGECLRTHVHLPNNEWAVIEGHDKRPLAVSRGAWPYLAWQVRDTPDSEPYLLPSEAFGPLPEVD